jgi:hypothetical protein
MSDRSSGSSLSARYVHRYDPILSPPPLLPWSLTCLVYSPSPLSPLLLLLLLLFYYLTSPPPVTTLGAPSLVLYPVIAEWEAPALVRLRSSRPPSPSQTIVPVRLVDTRRTRPHEA